jgi:predicted metalloprotease
MKTIAWMLALAFAAAPVADLRADTVAFVRDEPERITLTSADVAASNRKVAAAYGALTEMWTRELADVGARFAAPRVARYRGTARSACGVLPANNALYCYNNNTIYYDEVFLAAQAKLSGRATGTDGDMAAIGIIAHEVGHAVAFQLGYRSRSSYDNEAVADCLAGAFARQAERDGYLEHGDLDEAFHAMAMAGDPQIRTGDRRTDDRIASRVARQAHGTDDQRQENFRSGLTGGGGACLDALG